MPKAMKSRKMGWDNNNNTPGYNVWSTPDTPHRGGDKFGDKPVYEYKGEINRPKYVITVKISDFKGKVYFHLKKIYRNSAKTNYMSLEEKDFYDLFDNRTLFAKNMSDCSEAIKENYGTVPLEDEEEIQFDSIPKSQRTKELEASRQQVQQDQDLREQAIQLYMKDLQQKQQQQQQQQQQQHQTLVSEE